MENNANIPLVDVQKDEICNLLAHTMLEGHTWCLIDAGWMKQFKQYIGLNDYETSRFINVGLPQPGPIDNRNLFVEDGKDIRPDMVENIDYVLIHDEAWKLLVKWYGTIEGQEPITRKVVEFGVFVKHCKVEIYLLELKFCKELLDGRVESCKFSKVDKIMRLEEFVRKKFQIDDAMEVRLWSSYNQQQMYDVLRIDSTVQDEGLYFGQMIVVETRYPHEDWKLPYRAQTMMSSLPHVLPSTSSGSKKIMTTRGSSGVQAVDGQGPQKPPGVCGLCNLGNTCFMNSVIQCLSNCPPITDYFLKDLHARDLNIKNPIGKSGEVAKAFGNLIKAIWSGRFSYTVPQNFKLAVSKFAPQFCGYQQHDSQELLTFLLDGLHEDLNRIQLKPYIEQNCSSEDQSDQEMASETWNNYKMRNDSLIVDYFHGLLKSRVVCPACERVSITFDPFCSLSLPLPLKKDRVFQVRFVPYNQNMKEKFYKVNVSKKGRIKDICFELRRLLPSDDSIGSEDMIVAHVNESRFYKFYSLEDSVELLNDKDSIHVYDIPTPPREATCAVVPVCLLENSLKEDSTELSLIHLFGTPVICILPTTPVPFSQFYSLLCDRVSRQFSNHSCSNLKEETFNNGLIEREYHNDDYAATEADGNNNCFVIYLVNMATNVMTQIKDDHRNTDVFSERNGQQFVALQCSSIFRQKYYNENLLQPFYNNVSLVQKHRVGLQECLDLFTFTEKLGADDTWYCPRCQAHQRATKKFDLWEVPKILIVHLKRFSYTRFRRDKIDTLVEFPLQNLDLSNCVLKNIDPSTNYRTSSYYDLIGVCNHFGTLGGGHYTAFAKNKDNYQWYCFDDSNVSPISEENVVTNAAYVLFYMRKDVDSTINSTNMEIDNN